MMNPRSQGSAVLCVSHELIAARDTLTSVYQCLSGLIVALVGSAAMAQAVDTLKSADCRRAVESVQAREAAVIAARGAASQSDDRYRRNIDPQLETLRRHAARICLGGNGDSLPLPQRSAQRPIVVPSIAISRPAPLPALPTGPKGPSPKRFEPPTVVMACDAVGCWASDGSHLMRVGPNLLGPRGLCSVQGSVLTCP